MNKHLIIGAAAAGLVLGFAIWKGAGKAAAAVGEAVNPMNDQNLVNQGANAFYRLIADSDGSIGTDLYDAVYNGTFNPASTNNLIYRAQTSSYQAITGSQGSIGTDAYDAVESVKNWFGSWGK